MKTLFLLLISVSSFGQLRDVLKVEPGQITLQADSMTVREAFALLHYIIPKNQRINKVVYKDGVEYYQSKYLINRMLKRYAYTERKGKIKLVRI